MPELPKDELAAVWDEGFKAGNDYQRSMWHWSAGSLSRAVNGLKERPTTPKNPYRVKESTDDQATEGRTSGRDDHLPIDAEGRSMP